MLLKMQISIICWIWDNPRQSNSGMLGLSDLVQLMMRELLWAHPVKVTVEDEG